MKLHYKKFGQGYPLIILHGLYGSSDNWITVGKMLAEHFEVYIPDQRNHGESPHSDTLTYGEMKVDLKRFMDDHQLDKAILLGHSMGGKTVMFFAADYRERVSGLIVVDIAPKNYSKISGYVHKTTNHVNIINAMLRFDFTGLKSRSEINAKLSKTISSKRIRQFLLKNLKRNEDKSFRWKLNLRAIHNNLLEIIDGINDEDFRKNKHINRFPVLFIRGQESNFICEEDHDLIHTIFPGAKVSTIPNAGHWVHFEQPALLVEAVKEFYNKDSV